MTELILAITCFMLAIMPAALYFSNLKIFKRLPNTSPDGVSISILIPARNEERTIGECVRSVLANDSPLEVIVLDDASTDQTREIVLEIQRDDPRVRIETCSSLPSGWCGKQHACFSLAKLAAYDLFLFIDADVHVAPNAAARCGAALQSSDVGLLSGFPQELTYTFAERLLIPLIHFMLLGFLPIARMRRSTSPAYGAGCGQLFAAKRESYFASGGHSAIASSLHDGIKLPRAFRRAGFKTDIFDATDLASCHMYSGTSETIFGLAKNATEGIASPRAILPWTSLLILGQILPWIFLAMSRNIVVILLSAVAILASYPVRFSAAQKFKQSIVGAIFHPVGILILLMIQWYALLRKLFGGSSTWRGRRYA